VLDESDVHMTVRIYVQHYLIMRTDYIVTHEVLPLNTVQPDWAMPLVAYVYLTGLYIACDL
jgi:hypothetical protein